MTHPRHPRRRHRHHRPENNDRFFCHKELSVRRLSVALTSSSSSSSSSSEAAELELELDSVDDRSFRLAAEPAAPVEPPVERSRELARLAGGLADAADVKLWLNPFAVCSKFDLFIEKQNKEHSTPCRYYSEKKLPM